MNCRLGNGVYWCDLMKVYNPAHLITLSTRHQAEGRVNYKPSRPLYTCQQKCYQSSCQLSFLNSVFTATVGFSERDDCKSWSTTRRHLRTMTMTPDETTVSHYSVHGTVAFLSSYIICYTKRRVALCNSQLFSLLPGF